MERTRMHRALNIAEIVAHVVECAAEEEDEDEFPTGQTLFWLATTCKSFSEPALDLLWRELDTLDNLLKCLPEEHLLLVDPEESEEEDDYARDWASRKYHFRGFESVIKAIISSPSPEDWERVLLYARRVRTLTIDYDRHPASRVVFSLVEVFGHRKNERKALFLPSLRSLSWCSPQDGAYVYRFIPFFTGPLLREFKLITPPEDIPSPHPPYQGFPDNTVYSLAGTLPWDQLERVSVTVGSSPIFCPPLPSDLFDAVAARLTDDLISLTTDGLNLHSIAHVSGLARLKQLEIALLATEDLQPHVSQGILDIVDAFSLQPEFKFRFESLTDLKIHNGSFQAMYDFFELTNELRLQRFIFQTNESMLNTSLAQLYKSIAEHVSNTTLCTLSICHVERWKLPREATDANTAVLETSAPLCVGGSQLVPLLRFCQLRSVELTSPGGFELDDAALSDITDAWPLLERLSLLGCNRSLYQPGSLTLGSLGILAAKCPHLRELALVFDALEPPEPLCGSRCERLVQLDVSASRVNLNDDAGVAGYLVGIFPMLRTFRATKREWRGVEKRLMEELKSQGKAFEARFDEANYQERRRRRRDYYDLLDDESD